MTVQNVIDLAASAELKQLAVKTDTTAVIGFINLGLLELYKRFPLEEAEAILTLRDGKTSYRLNGTDTDVDMDTTKELITIVAAYTADTSGAIVQMPINDEDDLLGINTPRYDTVELPVVAAGVLISVIYRVAPKFLTLVTDILPIPPQLLEALLNYIGYRGHGAVDGSLNAENQSHYVRFNNSVQRAILDGLIPTDDMVPKKFNDRGFR